MEIPFDERGDAALAPQEDESDEALFLFPAGGKTLCSEHNLALLGALLQEVDESFDTNRACFRDLWQRRMLTVIAVTGCAYTPAQVDELWTQANRQVPMPWVH